MTIDTTNESGKILAEAFRPKYKYEDSNNHYARPFSDLMPIPQELQIESGWFGEGTDKQKEMEALYEANKAKYGHASWYDWCITNWGTKWDARVEDYIDDDAKEVYVYFETAWSPPVEFLKWFAEQYPDVTFLNEYDEEGCSFEGETSNDPKEGFLDNCHEIEEVEE
jgi:hypothetical protein